MRRCFHPLSAIPLGVTIFALAVAVTEPARADAKQERKVRSARWVYEELLLGEQPVVPEPVLRQTRCLAIFPDVTEAALGFGGTFGAGVASCRDEQGRWSPPAFLRLTGGSFGLQFGFRRMDLLLFFVTEEGAASLAKSNFSFGGEASLAAGAIDRRTEISTDKLYEKDIYLYARARGLFAGAALEGTRLAAAAKASEAYYGARHWPEEILFQNKVTSLPAEGQPFVDGLAGLPAGEDGSE